MTAKTKKGAPLITHDKNNNLTGSVSTAAKVDIPTPSRLERKLFPGKYATDLKSEESNYDALQRKIEERGFSGFTLPLFETREREIKEKIEKLEEEKVALEDNAQDLWIEFRGKGAEILNTHRPIYDLEKVTLENQVDWDSYRQCASCQEAYPCDPYREVKDALDKYSPEDGYDRFHGKQGLKVTYMLEGEAERYARDNVSQILSNGMTRGGILSFDGVEAFPIGLIVRSRDEPLLDDLWIQTREGCWAAVEENPGWYKLAHKYLKNKNFNVNHPFKKSDTLIIEGFIQEA